MIESPDRYVSQKIEFPPEPKNPVLKSLDEHISRLEADLGVMQRTKDMRYVIGSLLRENGLMQSGFHGFYWRDLFPDDRLRILSMDGIKILEAHRPTNLEDIMQSVSGTPIFSGSIRLHYWPEGGFELKTYESGQNPVVPLQVRYSGINDLGSARQIDALIKTPFSALLDTVSVYNARDGKLTPAIFADMANMAIATFLEKRYEHNPAVLKR